ETPELVSPVLIAAFEGWNDAAEAASGLVEHLVDVWDARGVARVDPEDFYDYQVNRPLVGTDASGMRRITWPRTEILVARPPGAHREVGPLPRMAPTLRRRQLHAEVLAAMDTLGVELVLTL